MSASPPAVEAVGLSRTFGSFTAVDSLDLHVAAGSVVAVLGPNGAGKTTVVRMLATLISPTGGRARVCGYDVATEGEEVRRRIALTGQFAALEDNLSAFQNLVLMARLRGQSASEAVRTADGLVERFDLGEFRTSLVKQLSGGQRRRVDLAAGLVVRPELLVLDEPTTGLDPRSRQVVWSTVRELVADGVTVLLTTQYLEEADALADRVVLIDHGRDVATGTPAELKARIGEHRVDIVAPDRTAFDLLVAALSPWFPVSSAAELRTLSIPAPGETADLATITEAVRGTGVAVDEIALRRPTLDDAFLALTGQPPELQETAR
jgi:ABC-2 type transport system ATP-binding protein